MSVSSVLFAAPGVGPGAGSAVISDAGAGGSGIGSATDAGGPSGATGVGSATVTVGAVGSDAGAAPPVVTVDVMASGGSLTIGSLTCGSGPWYSRSPPPPPPPPPPPTSETSSPFVVGSISSTCFLPGHHV